MAEEREQQAANAEAEERRSPSSQIVHQAILAEGTEELRRPNSALAWSGLAGGLSMGFSLITEASMQACLPDTPWRPLVVKFGYSIGFLIVILGRQQLFTENTLTPILPLLDRKEPVTLANVLRLWGVVLVTNLIGTLLVALVIARTDVIGHEARRALAVIGHEAIEPSFATVLLRGIFAGWLIALLVWLLPFAEAGRFWVIVAITYVIGIAGFSHVVAGSVDVFALAWAGQTDWTNAVVGFVIPALIGNVLGGVSLVAALNHAQVVAGKE